MKKLLALALASAFVLGSTGAARADATSDLAAKLDALTKQVDAVKAQLDLLKVQKPAPAPAPAAPAPSFIQRVPGDAATFLIGGETITAYGNLDLSFDHTTKGFRSAPNTGDSLGNGSYLSGISTNLSYIGVRGRHRLGPKSGMVYQLETELSISSTPGTINTNSNNDALVKGGLVSRNSFIGFQNQLGTFRIGKSDAPYKTSTAPWNPFNGHINDYAIVMGNSGGDNRVEFGTRLDHAIWYESVPFFGGWVASFMSAPGQNRASDSSNIAAGEAGCAGGNLPGSGALAPACNDGAWSAVESASLVFRKPNNPLSLAGAYEIHHKVNRQSDLTGVVFNGIDFTTPDMMALDVGDEHGVKGGAGYAISKWVSINGFYEVLTRDVPQILQFQNERTRTGFWLSSTLIPSPKDTISLGWARANPSTGDPGQHNSPAGLNPDNMANMFAFDYRHQIDRHVAWYVDWALTLNHPAAHYDLGAGGRGLTTDCHDAAQLTAFDPTNPGLVSGNGPHCYAGGRLQGFSTGVNVRF